MTFRKTTTEDISDVMKIIRQAQAYLKGKGVDQWQDGYPDAAVFEADVEKGCSYVLEENGRILGTLALIFDGEPTYAVIYDGKWQSERIPYATIHRIAVADEQKGKGIAGEMLAQAEKLCKAAKVHSIKIDTHEDNHAMKRFLIKNGFERCGVIYLENGAPRAAYEKRISRNRKDMQRSGWHRCLQKEYAESPCEFRGKKGIVSLSVLRELTAPLWVADRDGKTLIADTDYAWLQLAAEGEYFWMTSMFDTEGRLLQVYFDITNGTRFDHPGNPYFDDMYLDVVLSADGYIAVLDKDELDEAYQERIISRAEYERTLAEGEKLWDYLENNREEMTEFCRGWYRNLKGKMDCR